MHRQPRFCANLGLVLTILFGYVFARSDELSEGLVLVAGHCAIPSTLKRKVLLEVGVQVLFEGQIAYKAHSADAAVKFDTVEDFSLGCLIESGQKGRRKRCERGDLLFEGVRIGEGRAVGVGVRWSLSLGGRSGLVKNKISERQLLSFIERSERL